MSGALSYSPAIPGGTGRPQLAGFDPNNLTATPTQQMSIADQLSAVGIPMGKSGAGGGLTPSTVTPPPMTSESTTTTKSGGGGFLGGLQSAIGTVGGALGIGKTIAGLL